MHAVCHERTVGSATYSHHIGATGCTKRGPDCRSSARDGHSNHSRTESGPGGRQKKWPGDRRAGTIPGGPGLEEASRVGAQLERQWRRRLSRRAECPRGSKHRLVSGPHRHTALNFMHPRPATRRGCDESNNGGNKGHEKCQGRANCVSTRRIARDGRRAAHDGGRCRLRNRRQSAAPATRRATPSPHDRPCPTRGAQPSTVRPAASVLPAAAWTAPVSLGRRHWLERPRE